MVITKVMTRVDHILAVVERCTVPRGLVTASGGLATRDLKPIPNMGMCPGVTLMEITMEVR